MGADDDVAVRRNAVTGFDHHEVAGDDGCRVDELETPVAPHADSAHDHRPERVERSFCTVLLDVAHDRVDHHDGGDDDGGLQLAGDDERQHSRAEQDERERLGELGQQLTPPRRPCRGGEFVGAALAEQSLRVDGAQAGRRMW